MKIGLVLGVAYAMNLGFEGTSIPRLDKYISFFLEFIDI